MTAPSPSSTGRARLLALVALLIAGQGSALAHHLLVRHALCTEHGDVLEHLRGPHAMAGPADLAAPSVQAGESPLAADDDHHHCPLGGVRRVTGDLGTSRAVALAPSELPQCPGAAPHVAAGLAVLRLAPKQSPPHS